MCYILLFCCGGVSVLHTNLRWPCANQEVQRTNLAALIPDVNHDCCSSLSAVLDTCKLRHLLWEGGMENLNWVVSCLGLSKRMIFQEDGLYHLRLLWALLSLQPAWTAGPMLLLVLFLQRVSLCQTLQDRKCCNIC